MTSTIGVDIAKEHLTDGQDNITDTIKTIRRVVKSYPHLEPDLAIAIMQLTAARELMQLADRRLQS